MGYDKNVLIIIMNTNKVRFSETLKLLLASCIGTIPDVRTMLNEHRFIYHFAFRLCNSLYLRLIDNVSALGMFLTLSASTLYRYRFMY